MLTVFDPRHMRVPLKVWLEQEEDLDSTCRQQALDLSRLQGAFSHVALMPDTHVGFGMPIGGVLACEDWILPNAVGVDIGCGVSFIALDVPARLLREVKAPGGSLAQWSVQSILEAVPTGFSHHQKKQISRVLDQGRRQLRSMGDLPDLNEGYYQVGTLGGGNHFIELQEDQDGGLGIMIHSGSRNFGLKTAKYFHQKAVERMDAVALANTPEDLAYLTAESSLGAEYLAWLQLCLDFAAENRQQIMTAVFKIVNQGLQRFAGRRAEIEQTVDAHHNYVSRERHFGRSLWVHRKGAIRANRGELGIIPGAMGSFSYITRGLGNPDSFCSSSHGAGRRLGRREALRTFSSDDVLTDMRNKGIVFGKVNAKDAAEEYRLAYKNIEDVMALQRDLTEVQTTLQTVAVVKG